MRRYNILFFALAVLFATLSSCVTYKACQKRYPVKNDTIRLITIKDSIVLKDTIIFIHLPGEMVIDSLVIPCPDPGPAYIPKKVCTETSQASACAWFEWPVIKIELLQKDTTLQIRLDNAIKEAYHWKTEYEKVTITPPPVKFIPGFYKFATFCFIGLVLAFAGFVVLKILKYL